MCALEDEGQSIYARRQLKGSPYRCTACGSLTTLGVDLRIFDRQLWLCPTCAGRLRQVIHAALPEAAEPPNRGHYHAHRD